MRTATLALFLAGIFLITAQTAKDWQSEFVVDKKLLGVKGNNPYFTSTISASFTCPTPGAYHLWSLRPLSRGLVSNTCTQFSNVPAGVTTFSSPRISTRSIPTPGARSW